MRLADIRSRLKFRRSDRSPTKDELNEVINDVYRDICSRHRWSWLTRTHRFRTFGKLTLNDWTMVQHDRMATISSTQSERFPYHGKLVVINDKGYRLSNQHRNLLVEIDVPFPDASGSYTPVMYFDEVAMPRDCSEVVRFRLFTSSSDPEPIVPSMRDIAGVDPTETGEPRIGAVLRRDSLPRPTRALDAPTTVGSGAGPLTNIGGSATFKYWYSHVDRYTGAESALGPSVSATINDAFTWRTTPVVSTDVRERFDLRVYRSKADGDQAYRHSDVVMTDGIGGVDFDDELRDENLGEAACETASSMFLRLWPVPDEVYVGEVEYKRSVRVMSEDDDQPLFDEQFHHIILAGAEAILLDRSDEQSRAQSARERFERGISTMRRQDGTISTRRVRKGGSRVDAWPRGVTRIPRWVR